MKQIKVVAGIIRDGDKILATQRGYGEFKDGWEFPGGKLEPGESYEEALVRELSEELDMQVSVGELVAQVEYDYSNFHLSMSCYFCQLLSQDYELKEHEAARWLTKERLDTVAWLPADLTVIEALKKLL